MNKKNKVVALCPTCMKQIMPTDNVELNVKTGTARHAQCAVLRPAQIKALKELKMASIKIGGE